MREGRYTRPVDLSGYRAGYFAPHIFFSRIVGDPGCGASALSCITGIDPRFYARVNIKDSGHPKKGFSDTFMRKMLALEGYQAIELTKRGINHDRWIEYQIEKQHVILTSQLLARSIVSWVVIHNGLVHHNFQTVSLDGLDFLNKPTITTYCIWHPKWKVESSFTIDDAAIMLEEKVKAYKARRVEAQRLKKEEAARLKKEEEERVQRLGTSLSGNRPTSSIWTHVSFGYTDSAQYQLSA